MDNTIYKKIAKRCRLEQHIVRIENEFGCGTGFLYTVNDSIYVYIITVCHVILKAFVKKSKKAIRMDYRQISKEYQVSQFEICTLYEENELTEKLCENLEDSEYEERHRDIVILRIKKQEFFDSDVEIPFMYRLSEEKIAREINFVGHGFPDRKIHYEELIGICLGWESENKMMTCKALNISSQPFEDAMKGFSGTGLVADYEDSSVFIGVVAACDNGEMHQQFRVVGNTEISEKLKKIGWEAMEEYDACTPPAGFYRQEMMTVQDAYLEDMDVPTRQMICSELCRIDRECSPQQMLADEKFYDIPDCDRNRKSCSHYWCGRVWPLFVAKVLHGDVCDVYHISKDGKRLHIEYICSEGDGRADLASVVGAATSHSILGEQIPGDSILIWQSRKNPWVKRLFPREKFKRIINDIASGTSEKYKKFSRDAAYDLLDGEMMEKDYGVIHIQHLIEKLDGCQTEKEMKEKMEEILNEVWG